MYTVAAAVIKQLHSLNDDVELRALWAAAAAVV